MRVLQIEQQEMQAEIERMEREKELQRAREAERQKKLDEAAAKQRAREKEIEEREVSIASCTHCMPSNWCLCVCGAIENACGSTPIQGRMITVWVKTAEAWLHDLECAILYWHACQRCHTDVAPNGSHLNLYVKSQI